ncbi:MAG: HupE/UreJ family protein [Hyphomicrobiales bacterium]|nr:HupE/UreJ family protein [Hyphomicrobiales bacterium]
MTAKAIRLIALAAASLAAGPAFAHHVMDGKLPGTFTQGLLSGLGHPVIGLDHFASVVAVGCLAAAHPKGWGLIIGFVVAMMAGVGAHLQGATLPGAEIVVAGTVIGLGAIMLTHRQLSAAVALVLFVAVGWVHGYALGESIFGAEQTPLVAYLIGLAVIQSAIAFAAMRVALLLIQGDALRLRLIGAGIAGIGIAILVQQVVPAG